MMPSLSLSLSLSHVLSLLIGSMLPLLPVNSRRCASPGSQGAVVSFSLSLLLVSLSFIHSSFSSFFYSFSLSHLLVSLSLHSRLSLPLFYSFSLSIYISLARLTLFYSLVSVSSTCSLSPCWSPSFLFALSMCLRPSSYLSAGRMPANEKGTNDATTSVAMFSRYNPRADDSGCHPFDQSSVAIYSRIKSQPRIDQRDDNQHHQLVDYIC